MPSVTFTNNIGVLILHNAMISIADEWQWTANTVKRRKTVTVRGMVIRTENPGTETILDSLATNARTANGSRRPTLGQPGVLELPFTTLQHMMVQTIDIPHSAWQVAVPISITFVDDDPDENEYSVDFFGIEIINPSFTVPLPYRESRDAFVQQPIDTGGFIDEKQLTYRPIRTRLTHDNVRPVLSGMFRPYYPIDMEFITNRLSQRLGTPHMPVPAGGLPPGYPNVFSVQDFSPMLATRLPLKHMFVTDSNMDWILDKGKADISITMECPPQLLE
jgi:hypothetical protein